MASTSVSSDLNFTIDDPYRVGTGHRTLKVAFGGADFLEITFHRLLRIPEEEVSYHDGTERGHLPLYPIKQFAPKLPEDVKKLGGVMIPLFNREAMAVHLHSTRPYAVKLFVESHNAISGEPAIENACTKIRRKLCLARGESIRDYVLVGRDGVLLESLVTLNSKSRQFTTAASTLKFQILPLRRVGMCVLLRRLDGKVTTITSIEGLEGNMKVEVMKQKVFDAMGIETRYQVLIANNKRLQDGNTLREQQVSDGTVLTLLVNKQTSSSYQNIASESSHSSDDSDLDRDSDDETHELWPPESQTLPGIDLKDIQDTDWDRNNILTFNIAILNATLFTSLLGIKTFTTITQKSYAEIGIPFIRDEYMESKKVLDAVKKIDDVDFDAVKVGKANKKVLSIEIEKSDGEGLPQFLLESELIANCTK